MDKPPKQNPYYLIGTAIGWIIAILLACALVFLCAGVALRAGHWMTGAA